MVSDTNMDGGRSAASRRRAATPPEPSPTVSGKAAIPNAEPGPWTFCECGCGFVGGNDAVAEVYCGPWGDEGVDIFTGERSLVHQWGNVPTERAIANGRLIAAAPVLYAALEHILNGALSLPRFAEQEGWAALALASAGDSLSGPAPNGETPITSEDHHE